MDKPSTPPAPATPDDDLSPTEAHLARVMLLIQRVLPRLDEPGRAVEVQTALRKAASGLELALQAHQKEMGSRQPQVASGSAETEIVAVISAAIAAVLDRPYRLLSVQPSPAAVPYLNVWALEGRTQIFQSHKIR